MLLDDLGKSVVSSSLDPTSLVTVSGLLTYSNLGSMSQGVSADMICIVPFVDAMSYSTLHPFFGRLHFFAPGSTILKCQATDPLAMKRADRGISFCLLYPGSWVIVVPPHFQVDQSALLTTADPSIFNAGLGTPASLFRFRLCCFYQSIRLTVDRIEDPWDHYIKVLRTMIPVSVLDH